MSGDPPSASPIDPLGADRCRRRDVPGVGQVMVPRHIVRIDTGNTHGWQVRFEQPSKFFADPLRMARGAAALSSLESAKAHLKAIWKPVGKSRIFRNRAGKAGNPVPGVWTEAQERKGSTIWYVVAGHPDGRRYRRFYVGTRATYSPARLQAAQTRALEQRRAWLAEYIPPLR